MRRLILISALIGSSFLLTGCEDEFKDACVNDLGGKIISDTKMNSYSGIDSKTGGMVNGTVTESTRFCIKDGEVLMQS